MIQNPWDEMFLDCQAVPCNVMYANWQAIPCNVMYAKWQTVPGSVMYANWQAVPPLFHVYLITWFVFDAVERFLQYSLRSRVISLSRLHYVSLTVGWMKSTIRASEMSY